MKLNATQLLIFSHLIFSFSRNYAQINIDPEIKKNLKCKSYTTDTTVSGYIISKSASFVFDDNSRSSLIFKTRIKIISASALDEATVKVEYHSGKNIQNVIHIKGCTYNLDGKNEVISQFLDDSQIFKEKISDDESSMNFTLPSVKEGSVIEYEYTITSIDPVYGPTFYFGDELPVIHSELNTEIPNGLEYFFLMKGPTQYIHRSDTSEKRYMKFQEEYLYTDVQQTRFYCDSLPPLRHEEFVLNYGNFLPHMSFKLMSIGPPYVSTMKLFSFSFEDFSKEYLERVYSPLKISVTGAVKNYAAKLSAGISDTVEQIKIITAFVRDSITEIEESDIRYATNLDAGFAKRLLTQEQKKYVLCKMLQFAGVKSHLMLSSVAGKGYPYIKFLVVSDFNYLLVYARVDTINYFLDPSSKYRSWNQLPEYAEGRMGLMLDKKKPEWIYIPEKGKYIVTASANFIMDADGKLSGDVKQVFEGYASTMYRDIDQGEEEKSSSFFKPFKIAECIIDSFIRENFYSPDLPLKTKLKIQCNPNASVSEKHIYFQPMIFSEPSENPFKAEKRYLPVEFGYTILFVLNEDIQLPDGYEVDELPDAVFYKMENNKASFKRGATVENNIIHFSVILKLNQTYFETNDYVALKNFINYYLSKCEDQIVLRKK